MTRRSLYLAAPLFTPAERALNDRLAGRLGVAFDVFLPQRDGILLPGREFSGAEFAALAQQVFERDLAAVRRSDVLFAVLDGRTIDEGVAVEIGMAHALGKTCVGFRTDTRVLLAHGINPMITGAIHVLLPSEEAVDTWLAQQVVE
jgi:nucleoside 2-deoxyribosyltransferase